MMPKNIRPWRFAAWSVFISLTGTLSAAIPAPENLLPADTFFVITAPDCTALRKASAQAPQLLLWNDPAMKPFHDHFMDKWRGEFVAPLEQDLGVSLDDFADLPQGQLTLAVTRDGWDGQDDKKLPGFLLLLDAKDKSDLLKATLDGLQKKWAAAGKPIRTETVHGIPFSIVPLSSNDIPPTIMGILPASQPVQVLGQAPAAPRTFELVFAQYQSLLIVGSSESAVEPVVSRLTGGSMPCLADNSVFAADQASQFRDSPVYYSWLNARALFAVIAQIPAAQANPDAPSMFPPISPSAILNASGLIGLKSISVSYHQSHEGALLTVYLSAPESDRQGLLKMIATSPKDAGPPVFVPADAVKFWRWRVDSQKVWAELQKTVGGIYPGALGTLNGAIDTINSLAQQKDPGFDIRKNLLANLGDDWLSYERGPAGTTLEALNKSRGILLFATANPDQTILSFQTTAMLSGSQDGVPAPQNFMGHSIHALAFRPQVMSTGPTAQNLVYCTASSGYMAMSSDISVLQDYLRDVASPPRPLADTPGLADAAGHVGGTGTGLFGFDDHRIIMRAAFSGLKQPGAQLAMPFLPKTFSDWVDFSLLPDYDQVAKYFYFSVFSGATTTDGILFRGYYPRPPLLN